ncbi:MULTISPECIES: hypothetical protein [unclassified Streptomyces]|uniref:hypothetical protein n=1 Tax=unclassified Streptomyces TaxID=2593676 RepID=UPI000B853F86|nr:MULTISPECIES: hypothetical protein [unclassified Streptomyces]
MANLVYKRVSTDQQSTARQNLVLHEAGIEDPRAHSLLATTVECRTKEGRLKNGIVRCLHGSSPRDLLCTGRHTHRAITQARP